MTLPVLSKFGPEAIDRAINAALVSSIPGEDKTAVLDLKLTSRDGEKVLTGVLAAKVEDLWGKVDVGGAIGGALDLEDRDDWEVEAVVKASW